VGQPGKYITSYLKAVYGDQATKDNDFGYAWLPKLDEGMEASWLPSSSRCTAASSKGSSTGNEPGLLERRRRQGARCAREAQVMVSVDLYDHETASFWRGRA